jgi:acetyl-CoA carboxylase biotin carboxyl carrier protein
MTGQDDQNQQTSPETREVIESVRELISMMAKGGINELDLTAGDVTIRLRGHNGNTTNVATVVHQAPHSVATAMPEAPQEPEGNVITSPMIGTYYSAPSPGESPFVQIGDEIEVGQVIGIIEAMKIMNEITADHSGVVSEIMVQNAQPVEYGSPLMRVVAAEHFE